MHRRVAMSRSDMTGLQVRLAFDSLTNYHLHVCPSPATAPSFTGPAVSQGIAPSLPMKWNGDPFTHPFILRGTCRNQEHGTFYDEMNAPW
jgi:hypothetical protein